MKFTYVGDPLNDGDGPSEIMLFGFVFTKGKAIEVTSEAAMAKLATNSHFKAAKSRAPKAEADGNAE